MLLSQTLAIFVVSIIGYLYNSLSSGLLNRPIVTSALVGIALGDIPTGCMAGAALELVYLGSQAIGASNPPDMISGTIIGTAYVITTGADVASSVAIAIPVSLLMSMVWESLFRAILGPLAASKADAYAQQCNRRGIDMVHYLFTGLQLLTLSGLCAAGFYAGANAIQGIVDSIPTFVTDGFKYAMGVIPAIGFALLARMIMNKRLACFLFLGFLLVAYGGMNIVGVTAAAAVVAAILVLNVNTSSCTAVEGAEDDNEF